ncbi:hypothetical protein INT47_002818 [Mucor saturninus]|uniref:Uncharacterized protein n=1 Tax=Mucor saturninus TaxID=64648 RepID=A0A8H7UUW4_9FUNG|nr:hypothetical protein INT47_002818 [Mucor saturninus]
MIARSSLKTLCSRTKFGQLSKRFYSHNDNKNQKQVKAEKKTRAPDIPSFMPVVNIPVAELAHNAFYSLHRPLLGLSIPQPFLVGDIVGQIKEENESYSEEAILQYMMSLKPFQPPTLEPPTNQKTSTLTVEVDSSYFMNHNNNHDEIADYLTAMQEKLDFLYDEKSKRKCMSPSTKKKTTKRLRKRKGFFEKN